MVFTNPRDADRMSVLYVGIAAFILAVLALLVCRRRGGTTAKTKDETSSKGKGKGKGKSKKQ
jgi:hypothetical protein